MAGELRADPAIIQMTLSGAAIDDDIPAVGEWWWCRKCGSKNRRGHSNCWSCGARRTKGGAERRAQYKRKDARTIQELLGAFQEVTRHRGGELTKLASALQAALSGDQDANPRNDLDADHFEDLVIPTSETRMDDTLSSGNARHGANEEVRVLVTGTCSTDDAELVDGGAQSLDAIGVDPAGVWEPLVQPRTFDDSVPSASASKMQRLIEELVDAQALMLNVVDKERRLLDATTTFAASTQTALLGSELDETQRKLDDATETSSQRMRKLIMAVW